MITVQMPLLLTCTRLVCPSTPRHRWWTELEDLTLSLDRWVDTWPPRRFHFHFEALSHRTRRSRNHWHFQFPAGYSLHKIRSPLGGARELKFRIRSFSATQLQLRHIFLSLSKAYFQWPDETQVWWKVALVFPKRTFVLLIAFTLQVTTRKVPFNTLWLANCRLINLIVFCFTLCSS